VRPKGFYPPKVMDADPVFEKSPSKVEKYTLKSKTNRPKAFFGFIRHARRIPCVDQK